MQLGITSFIVMIRIGTVRLLQHQLGGTPESNPRWSVGILLLWLRQKEQFVRRNIYFTIALMKLGSTTWPANRCRSSQPGEPKGLQRKAILPRNWSPLRTEKGQRPEFLLIKDHSRIRGRSRLSRPICINLESGGLSGMMESQS